MNTDKKKSILHLCLSVFIGGLIALCLIGGCDRRDARRVVLYTSIDEPVARPIIKDFEKRTGITVVLVTDSEATKSVGLTERLRAERANPQADVWWSNEPFHTINLADEGALTAYDSPARADVPDRFKDAQKRWCSTGFRIRVMAAKADQASSDYAKLDDLLRPELKGKIALARPTAGSTGGHVAALYVLWGEQRADTFLRALHANEAKLLGGNSAVAESLARGTTLLGLTDNDDVVAASRIAPLKQIIPDQDSSGTLLIPTTVGLVAGRASSADAKLLIDYLLSRAAEQQMIDASFAFGSIREIGSNVKAMEVDYSSVAKALPHAVRRATALLEGRE